MSRVFLSDIIAHSAKAFGVTVADIKGRSRQRHHVRARQAAFYVASKVTPMSMLEMGRRLDRDHSTVIHSIGLIAALIERDADLRAAVEDALQRALEGPASPEPEVRAMTAIERGRHGLALRQDAERQAIPAQFVKQKNNFGPIDDEEHDSAHLFHSMMARGSVMLLAAIEAAR